MQVARDLLHVEGWRRLPCTLPSAICISGDMVVAQSLVFGSLTYTTFICRPAVGRACAGGDVGTPDMTMACICTRCCLSPVLKLLLFSNMQADTEKSELETAINNARETCEGGPTGECANAWDDVEELSAELGHKRERAKDTKKDVLEE